MKNKYILALFLLLFLLNCSKKIEYKALLLDYNLNPPIVNSALGRIFTESGIRVEYRQYYPSLIKSDFIDYDFIILLSGKTPGSSSAQISENEIDHLTEYVQKGGILFLGAEYSGKAGHGNHERILFNRLLEKLNIDIRINEDRVQDINNGYPSPLFYKSYFHVTDLPFFSSLKGKNIPLENTSSLWTGENAMVILTSSFSTILGNTEIWINHKLKDEYNLKSRLPVIAVGKSEKGFAVVATRHLYNSIGYNYEVSTKPLLNPENLKTTELFLRKFTSFLKDLKKDNNFTPGNYSEKVEYIKCENENIIFFKDEVREFLPDSVVVHAYNGNEPIWKDYKIKNEYLLNETDYFYKLINRDNFNVGKAIATIHKRDASNFVELSVLSGVNSVWTITNAQQVFNSTSKKSYLDSLRNIWGLFSSETFKKGIDWFPGVVLYEPIPHRTKTKGIQGQIIDFFSPVSSELWEANLSRSILYFLNFFKNSESMKCFILDISLRINGVYSYPNCFGFEDTAFFEFLKETNGKIDRRLWQGAYENKDKDRFKYLKNTGLLGKYFEVLENIVKRYAETIRMNSEKIRPDVYLAVASPTLPVTWFERGVVKGLGQKDKPVIYFTSDNITKPYINELKKENIYIVPVSAFTLGMTSNFDKVFDNCRKYSYGYWLNRLGWLIDPPDYYHMEAPIIKDLRQVINLIRTANTR